MTQQTPTQKIQNWINNFVTQPNPVFGNLPPCPFARKAVVDNKVVFEEMAGQTKTKAYILWAIQATPHGVNMTANRFSSHEKCIKFDVSFTALYNSTGNFS